MTHFGAFGVKSRRISSGAPLFCGTQLMLLEAVCLQKYGRVAEEGRCTLRPPTTWMHAPSTGPT